MGKHESTSAKDAVDSHRQFYADLPRPRDARECAEESDEARAVLMDEAAEKLRACGATAAVAAQHVRAVMEVLATKDRALCGEEEAVELAESQLARISVHAVPRERLIEALSQIWAWPDSRKGLGALFFALGAPLYGCNSMRALAKLRGVSVEDVSNVVDELQRILGLPRNGNQKSAAAVESYGRSNGARVRETSENNQPTGAKQ